MNKHIPKHFVLQLGSLLALYVSITSLIILIFGVVNLRFPDAAAYSYEAENAREAIRACIATLIVFFPTYLVLTRFSNQMRRKETGGAYTPITRWLVYLSLLVAAGTMLVDLVTLIMFFLDGEITRRFLIKVFALLLVVGTAFHYYVLDVRGYFIKRVDQSIYFGLGAFAFTFAMLGYGFSHIETPQEVREMRLDDQQVADLQNMHYRIQEMYRVNEALPQGLEDLYNGIKAPTAPEGRDPYVYEITDDTHYKLCATFAVASEETERSVAVPFGYDSWEHGEGYWCFQRVALAEKQI